jgi:xanthine dehydrogenase accessory factor
LIDHARGQFTSGQLISFSISGVDALINGVPEGGKATCICVPATELPSEIWQLLIDRHPICITCETNAESIKKFNFYTSKTLANAPQIASELFAKGTTGSLIEGKLIVSVWFPITRLVIAGLGPIAESLDSVAQLIGWNVSIAGNPDVSTGMIMGLSPVDATVIMHHNVEDAGRALSSALDSRVGYIGAVGSKAMQVTRANWLAYRGYSDISRIYGPAGLPIGAKSPSEIAISILAEAMSAINLRKSA